MADTYPTASTAALWIANESTNTEYKPLIAVLTDVLTTHHTRTTIEGITDLAEDILIQVNEELKNIIAQEQEDGISRFEIDDQEDMSFIRFFVSRELALCDELISRTPAQFEEFCKEMLGRLGATSIYVTGGINDGGIDFVGHDLCFGTDKGPFPRGARVLVLGQSKKHDKGINISESELRKFIGGVSRKAFEYRKKENIGIYAPIVYAFWTTSDFHTSAKEYAKAMGIWYLNGIGLSQLALRCGFTGFC